MVDGKDFFEDIAVAIETWTATATDALTNPSADLIWTEYEGPYKRLQERLGAADRFAVRDALAECFRGLAASVLTALDGGTRLAEKSRVYLVDEQGRRLGKRLHNEFVGYLMDTARLK